MDTSYFVSSSVVFYFSVCLAVILCYRLLTEQARARRRLELLRIQSRSGTNSTITNRENAIDWRHSASGLNQLKGRLGKAGFFTPHSRRWATIGGFAAITCSVILFSTALFAATNKFPMAFVGALVGVYFGLLGWLYYLRGRASNLQRELLFRLPLSLEAILLLVQSGLGILPAIQTVVTNEKKKSGNNPVVFMLSLVYELAASGLQLSTALDLVANSVDNRVIAHVFLHLDISANEGGELSTSLRSLSDYAHSEWKLSVETRVRRLENLVVFPVFCALFGLVLITVAVPIVPIADFMKRMSNENQVRSEAPLLTQNPTPIARGD